MSDSNNNRPHVLLITGVPGIGKTTVIRRAAEALGAMEVRGFFTEEIREARERQGFRLVDFLSGRESIIARSKPAT